MNYRPTMLLLDGNTLLDLENPSPKKIWFEDIATALSRIKRWCGRGALSISVAQHSVYVAIQLPEHLQLAGLLHDAHEAYTGDISTPVKKLIRSTELQAAQDRIDKIIHNFFGIELSDREREQIKTADMAVCAAEMIRNFGFTRAVDKCLTGYPNPAKIKIAYWPESHARNVWLEEFYRLTSGIWDYQNDK